MTTPAANGAKPTPTPEQQQLEEFVYANYQQVAGQLAAVNTLMAGMPLAALLAANKRHQSTGVLMLPAGVTVEQAQARAVALRGDQRVIEAALHLQRTVAAVVSGG